MKDLDLVFESEVAYDKIVQSRWLLAGKNELTRRDTSLCYFGLLRIANLFGVFTKERYLFRLKQLEEKNALFNKIPDYWL